MQLLIQAEAALVRNWRLIAIYTVASVVAVTAYGLVTNQLTAIVPEETTPKPLWYVLTSLGIDLGLAALIASFQAIAFAELGREIDRPLWKCGGTFECLQRFFVLWFILNLLFITSARVGLAVPEEIRADVSAAMLLFRLGLTLVGIPVGACIMYGGGLHWKQVPDMLAPFFQQFSMTLVAVAIGFLQFLVTVSAVLSVSKETLDSPWFWAVVNVPLVLLECLAFAVMWLVCMHHRDVAAEHGDDDFDL